MLLRLPPCSSGTVPRPFVSMEMRNDQVALHCVVLVWVVGGGVTSACMGASQGKMGIAERKRLAEEAKRKADEEAMLNSTFKANELNPKVMEAKYHRLLEEAEIRRKANVTKRKAVSVGIVFARHTMHERPSPPAPPWRCCTGAGGNEGCILRRGTAHTKSARAMAGEEEEAGGGEAAP